MGSPGLKGCCSHQNYGEKDRFQDGKGHLEGGGYEHGLCVSEKESEGYKTALKLFNRRRLEVTGVRAVIGNCR
jgi:hypothetical protein